MSGSQKMSAQAPDARVPAEAPGKRMPRHWSTIAELALIATWVLIVAHGYLDMNPRSVPTGSEFGIHSQSNHLWTQFEKCGWCAVWNGTEGGGAPAFVDARGSMLHPIVAVSTLIFGVVNGVKITILVSLWLVGLAQWWIAKGFNVGWAGRLWSAGIAVAGGHLASRMEIANYQFLLATAAVSLFLAGLLHLRTHRSLGSAALVGVLLGSTLLAGQGYMQIGLLGMLLAIVVFVIEDRSRLPALLKQYLVVAIIGLLLAAPLLVPLIHFLPHFAKDNDPGTFTAAQPLAYLPLNLVINDFAYYHTDTLGKMPFPQLYSLYIGWLPVLLAALGASQVRRTDRGKAWFFGLAIALSFVLASGVVFKATVKYWPAVATVRFPSVIAGAAIPLILGFSGIGADYLFRWGSTWPKLSLGLSTSTPTAKWRFPLAWILFIPFALSLQSVYAFSQQWYRTIYLPEDVFQLLSALRTPSLQWVEPPYGALYYIEPAVAMDLKLSPGFMDVRWSDRSLPQPAVYASLTDGAQGSTGVLGSAGGATIYSTDQQYATVTSGASMEPCQASGSGGYISVSCNPSAAGTLTVQENTWTGWYAWMDGRPIALAGDKWLSVQAPAGDHHFEFRYLPWDVPVGLALFVLGVGLCIWAGLGTRRSFDWLDRGSAQEQSTAGSANVARARNRGRSAERVHRTSDSSRRRGAQDRLTKETK